MFKAFPQLKRREPLSKHCWYALGGPADFFVEVNNTDDIPKLIREARANNLPYFILGGGSNTVFHDEGFRGLIIKVVANNLEFKDDFEGGSFVIADPGVLTSQIAKESIDRGFTGIESLYGLPGTIGGAIFGNAEAHKTSIGDFIESVILYDADTDSIREVGPEYFGFAYRHSALHKTSETVLKVVLKLKKIDSTDEIQKQKAIDALNFRKEHQPTGRNNGSFFKNPEGDSAGRLIDIAGLKGTKIGGAYISEKHGNFFMNDGTATTEDLVDLKTLAQRTVKEKFDINLQPEVRIIMPDGTCLSD